MSSKIAAIIGGGTISRVCGHLGLCAPAFGTTARQLQGLVECRTLLQPKLHLTRMAGGKLESNEDISMLVDELVMGYSVKMIFFTVAIVDFEGDLGPGRPKADREYWLKLKPTEKIISRIRKERKDIFLVGFKQTCGLSEDDQYIEGLNLCKKASCNLVLANDSETRLNMIITPEEARYHVTTNREEALSNLVEMANLRSHLTFTRSTVVAGAVIPWSSELVPSALRTVVDFCVEGGAYKPFNGVTVGHFACKIGERTFLTSIRRSNFNNIYTTGLVQIETDGDDSVLAYGAKPSVGGQSQRIVFHENQEYDCIVHFHCPKREGSKVPSVSQREFECGSHECGKNTSNGLVRFGSLSAVYLENHGPNIVFNRSIDPKEVIDFITENFILSEKTGGYVIGSKSVLEGLL